MFPFNTDELLHVATCHHLTLFRDRRAHGTERARCHHLWLLQVCAESATHSLSLSLARSAFAGL